MQWTSNVELDQFAVLKIDPTANVFSINDKFVHTIQDGSGYRHVVRIPPARQASTAWMLEHSEHTRSQIERLREEDRVFSVSTTYPGTTSANRPQSS